MSIIIYKKIQLYELIAHKLWKLDDEHTIIYCIFSFV